MCGWLKGGYQCPSLNAQGQELCDGEEGVPPAGVRLLQTQDSSSDPWVERQREAFLQLVSRLTSIEGGRSPLLLKNQNVINTHIDGLDVNVLYCKCVTH